MPFLISTNCSFKQERAVSPFYLLPVNVEAAVFLRVSAPSLPSGVYGDGREGGFGIGVVGRTSGSVLAHPESQD